MRRNGYLIVVMCAALAAAGCAGGGSAGERTTSGNPLEQTVLSTENSREARPLTTETQAEESGGPGHTWAINPEGTTLESRFPAPEGFSRVYQEEGSFGSFVRNFSLLPDGEPVRLYDGRLKGNQGAAAAVFAMPVLESGDVQQCADSVMRMYAEYFWHSGQPEKIGFHFVNGFWFDYPTYRDGGRVKVNGNSVSWSQSASYDDSYEAFERYLFIAFSYSSTLSMWEESKPADIGDVRIGDVFLRGASPGHVVMVADVCEDGQGRKAFLLAQSYMPAQQFHVLNNPLHREDPWYYVDEVVYPFATPEYSFDEGSFRRMNYLDGG